MMLQEFLDTKIETYQRSSKLHSGFMATGKNMYGCDWPVAVKTFQAFTVARQVSSEKPRLRPISEVGEWAESTDKEMEEGKLTNVADEW